MVYPIYPINKCPYPVRDNFSQQYGEKFTASKMDSGRSRMRRKLSNQSMALTITFNMKEKELDWFEAWLRYDVAQAAGFFTIALNPDLAPGALRMTKYPVITADANVGFIVSCEVERVREGPTGSRITSLRQWPATLPPPEKNGYAIQRPDGLTRSSIAGGLPSERSRFDDAIGVVNFTWLFTQAEYNIFDDFVHNQLFGGLAPFKGWFWNGRGTTDQQIVQFTESPKTTAQDAIYKVTAVGQIRNIPVMSHAEYVGSNINLAETLTVAGNGAVNKTTYHDGSYAEFDYTNDAVATF